MSTPRSIMPASYEMSNDEEQDQEAAGSELPDHLIESILVKLPMKTLLRLRSLCKQWEATIIKSPSFARLHMKNNQPREQTTSSSCFVVVHSDKNSNVYADKISIIPRPEEPPVVRLGVVEGRQSKSYLRYQLSTCNGLVCMSQLRVRHGRIEPTSLVRVWNPVTGQLKDVSSPVVAGFERKTVVAGTVITGFGYDPTSDDYKIVYTFLTCTNSHSRVRVVHFTSLKSNNAWRSIDTSTSPDLSRVFGLHNPRCHPVTVCGNVYWIVKYHCAPNLADELKILRCNLADEKFELLPFPHHFDMKFLTSFSNLGCYEDSLYLVHPIIPFLYVMHSIWVLDMKDNNAIWRQVGYIPTIRRGQWSFKAVGFNSSGHVILKINIGEKLVWLAYVPIEDKFVDLEFRSGYKDIHLMEMETLISP